MRAKKEVVEKARNKVGSRRKARGKVGSRRKAIMDHCYLCSGESAHERRLCTAVKCCLWPYRRGKYEERPRGNATETLTGSEE